MGTKYELLEKIQSEGHTREMTFHVVGIGIGIDREQTTAVYDKEGNVIPVQKDENAIRNFFSKSGAPVFSVAGIRETIRYLYEEKVSVLTQGKMAPIDEKAKAEFDEYLRTYGVE